MDISVCVPVHNEKEALRPTILELIEAFDKLPYKYEIIVIDDGSSDDCIDAISNLGVRIIRHARNFGGGVARVTGMRYAKGNIIFQTDADGTYPCDKIPEMMEQMKTADMVVGSRNRESATDWFVLRTLIKWFLRKTASALTAVDIPDLNSGMRVYKRDLALSYAYLYPKGHSIMSTMTLAMITEGWRVEYQPIDYRKRIGKSSFRPLRDTYNYAVTIIRTIVYFDPLKILMPISLFFFGVALFFTARDLLLFQRINNITAISWLTSLITIVLAVLSDQMSRISKQLGHLMHDFKLYEGSIEEITPCKEE